MEDMMPQESEGIPKFIIITFAMIGILMIVLAANSVLASLSEKTPVTSVQSPTGSKLTLNVNIPCAGHASLIIYEVKKLEGITSVEFKGSGIFDVYYDPAKTSEERILALDIFKEYPAVRP